MRIRVGKRDYVDVPKGFIDECLAEFKKDWEYWEDAMFFNYEFFMRNVGKRFPKKELETVLNRMWTNYAETKADIIEDSVEEGQHFPKEWKWFVALSEYKPFSKKKTNPERWD